jgi:hypothetical protein
MTTTVRRTIVKILFPALALAFFGVLFATQTSQASLTGVLKLKVARCPDGQWISGATVDVVVVRPGYGQVASASGTTDSTGYVEFTFGNLEPDDEAHVTITPSGESPDGNHLYAWTLLPGGVAGFWDLGVQSDSGCSDTWYSEKTHTILSYYQ